MSNSLSPYRSALKTTRIKDRTGIRPVPILADAPVLRAKSASRTHDLSSPNSPVKHSGSPERRLRILELEARREIQSTPQCDIELENPRKKARFADLVNPPSSADSDKLSELTTQLQNVSKALADMTETLRKVQETQENSVSELAKLKEAVRALEAQKTV